MYLSQLFIKRFGICLAVLLISPIVIGVIYVPADYPTIQGAINAIDPNNDTTIIIVSPGTYYENISFNGKDIILTSTNPEDPNVVAATIIDGQQNDPNLTCSVVTFSGSETSDCYLKGFVITNGLAEKGGGVYGNGTLATIANCTIINNTSNSGGGLYGCNGTITNCIINSNITETSGGGLFWCAGTIINCMIASNSANSGGGLCGCIGTITNCTIKGNSAVYSGGGLKGCDGTITNCIIAGNTVTLYDGGGLSDCRGTITHCTITNNTTVRNGGGLWSMDSGYVTIVNCIFWGNSAGNAGNQVYKSIPVYSCIQNWAGGGTGNISGDPMFIDTSSTDPLDWDLHLTLFSSCIDTGTNAPAGGLPTTDIEGYSRPFDGNLDGTAIADMGAYEFHEFPEEPYLHVTPLSFKAWNTLIDPNMIIKNFGTQTLNWSLNLINKPDWLTITPTSGSLEYAQSEVVTLSVDITGLSFGQYNYSFDVIDPAAQNSPQPITILLDVGNVIYVPADYPTIQGAIDAADPNNDTNIIIVSPGTYYENITFNGKDIILTSTNPEDPNVVAATIIDGQRNGGVVTFAGSETSACQLKGFTITNGYKEYPVPFGAGITGNGTKAAIDSCIIRNNAVWDWTFSSYGTGIHDCDGLIRNCIIQENSGTSSGMLHSPGDGLALCDGMITCCIIANNEGSGLYVCNGTIENCTITGNMVGIANEQSCPVITNCIIWDNGNSIYNSNSTPVITYSNVEGGYSGTGNTNVSPIFADAVNSDYHLQSQYGRWNPNNHQWAYDAVTSPCIDTGDPGIISYWDPNGTPADPNDDFWDTVPGQWLNDPNTSPCIDAGDPASDWTNELWPHGGRINMGAYGGTPQASMSGNPVGNVADLNHDDAVDLTDLVMFCDDWLAAEYLLDTDLNRSNRVDIADFAVFTNQWLWVEP